MPKRKKEWHQKSNTRSQGKIRQDNSSPWYDHHVQSTNYLASNRDGPHAGNASIPAQEPACHLLSKVKRRTNAINNRNPQTIILSLRFLLYRYKQHLHPSDLSFLALKIDLLHSSIPLQDTGSLHMWMNRKSVPNTINITVRTE